VTTGPFAAAASLAGGRVLVVLEKFDLCGVVDIPAAHSAETDSSRGR
jgi:hypothetical protein